MTEKLNILAIGAGAIGTYLGGSLALQGHQVIFYERAETAAILANQGMTLDLPGGRQSLKPEVSESLNTILSQHHFDAAIFVVKSFHTASAIADLSSFVNEMPPILCMQNGVENEPALEAVFGKGRVIPGTLTSAVGKPGQGHIVLERLRGVGIAGPHRMAPALVTAMQEAGLNARYYPDGPAMKWSKMLTNLVSNATSAILNMTPAEVFSHPGLHRIEMAQVREALKVMDKLKIQTVNLPGTPVRLLAAAARFLPLAVSRPFMQRIVGKGRGAKMPSFHIDLYGGSTQSEVEYLNGAVVRFGQGVGVPTQVNAYLTQTLLALASGKLPLRTYAQRPDEFLRDLATFLQVG